MSIQSQILTVTFVSDVSDSDFSSYLAALDEKLTDNEPRVTLVDARQWVDAKRQQVQLQGEWIKTHRERLKILSLGTAIVLSSARQRFLLSTIFMIQRPPGPHIVVADLADAQRWCRQRILDARKSQLTA